MEYLLDNPETEKVFRQIIKSIPSMQNGVTAESMLQRGLKYEKNWGASVVDLKNFASQVKKDHLLALKLWNKKWRETMILATLLDIPGEVTEAQMDFWLKTSENTELIEQMVFNLFTETPFAFAKAIEWCRGKKHLVKYAGLLMMGRMAMASKSDIDEMFEIFFEELIPLAKDPALYNIYYKSYCQLARRSKYLHEQCINFAEELLNIDEQNAKNLGNEILHEIKSDDFILLIKN